MKKFKRTATGLDGLQKERKRKCVRKKQSVKVKEDRRM